MMELSTAPGADAEAVPPEGRRRLAARGVIINSVFLIFVGSLNLLKALIVAGFLTRAEFGVWIILLLAVTFLVALKSAAVGERFIQQDEADQELAFQKAFTLELISAGFLAVIVLAAVPLLALVYGQTELVAPGFAMAAVLIGLAFQAPIWVFYRRMNFTRQRLLASVDPIVSFVVTVVLVASGVNYWSLVIGAIAGAWVGGGVALLSAPYPFAFRFDRETAWGYISFSWPLIVAVVAGMSIGQLSVLFGDLALGLAGAGAIGLAGTYYSYVNRLDQVVTQALYPAICRVVDRPGLMLEVFVKSNRLALMWGIPFGTALTLFVPDLIEFGIGENWLPAQQLLQVSAFVGAVNHLGFNWSAFYRAAGKTRPIAIVNASTLAAFLVLAVPMLFAWGLDGFAWGMVGATSVSLILRARFVRALFPGFRLSRHVIRSVAPTVLAVAAVLILRVVGDDPSLAAAMAELATYVIVTIAATALWERRLLREALGYLRGPNVPATPVA